VEAVIWLPFFQLIRHIEIYWAGHCDDTDVTSGWLEWTVQAVNQAAIAVLQLK